MARIPLPVGSWGNISVSGKRGNYRAAARIRLANGKTTLRFRTGATKEQARNALREHLTEMQGQIVGGEVDGAVTLGTFADDWMERWEAAEPRRAGTLRVYRPAIRWIKDELGRLRLTECTTGRLEKGVQRIADEHGYATAKQCRSLLRTIFADAVRLDALTANPALGVSPINEVAQEVRAMTIEEVTALRTAAKQWEDAPIKSNRIFRREIADSIDVMLGTGVRIGELLGIRWDDYDLDADQPTVSVMGTVTLGVDGGGVIYQPAPKSEKSERTLYLPRIAVDALRRQHEAREFRVQSEAVFASETGTWRDPNNYRAHFRKVREIAKLDWVTPKTIRKTVATAVNRAEGLDVASRQLGHSEVAVTAKHYVQRLNVGPSEVVGALDSWLESVS